MKSLPTIGMIIGVAWLAFVVSMPTMVDNRTPNEKAKDNILRTSKVATVTVGSEGRHRVSAFWVASGAFRAGYDVGSYELAVATLNPRVDLGKIKDGDLLRVPMKVRGNNPEETLPDPRLAEPSPAK